jgi:hypothetical protein
VSSRLTPLSEYRSTPKPLRLLPTLLVASAVLDGVSMLFVWHHHDIPGEPPQPLFGYATASWLGVGAVITLAFAVRFSRWGFGFYGRWLLSILTVVVCIGMFTDHLDADGNAAALYVTPFYGPGFFVGAAGATMLLAATVLSWRTED